MRNGDLLRTWQQRWDRNLLRFLGRRVYAAVDIEDLAQETYLRLLRSPNLGEVRNPEAYLIRVASNVVAEWRQGQLQAGAQSSVDEDLLVEERTPDVELDRHVLQRRLHEVLSTFSPQTRAVLVLRLRDGCARKEIAQALEMTERQVKRHLARGYDRLRRKLDF